MKDLSIVVTCKGRLDHLKQTVKAFMPLGDTALILVDYDCPDECGKWAQQNFPEIQVVHVPDRPNFNASEARNIGAQAAKTHWLGFVDVDVAPRPELFNFVTDNLKPGFFYKIDENDVFPAQSVMGTCFVAKVDWERVGGYEEVIRDRGVEDLEFYDVLRGHGVSEVKFSPKMLYHINHDNDRRSEFCENKKLPQTHFISWLYYMIRKDIAGLQGVPVIKSSRVRIYEVAHELVTAAIADGRRDLVCEIDTGMILNRDGHQISRKLNYKVQLGEKLF